jgi:hypothetical protein
MAKKEIFYQGLADLQVAIDDFSTTSPDYFRVTKAPTELYSGLNIFKFKGNPSLFVESAPVYIEILDSNGAPIYYEVGLDFESAEQSAIVTIHINEDVTPGTGYIVMCATAKQTADGQLLDTSGINLRWHIPVYIDPSKRNETEIVFDELPEVNVVGTTAVFSSPDYNGLGTRYNQVDNYNLEYYNYNGTAIIVTSSLSSQGFDANALGAEMYIDFALSGISSQNADIPTLVNSGVNVTATEITSGYIVLSEPISEPIYNSNSKWVPSNLSISELDIVYETSGSLAVNATENSFNVVNVSFTNLTPQLGTIAKIRSYYTSTGVGTYTLINETDILNQANEFGFTPNSASISFALPTLQRNERIDFKFEFVNPYGIVSKQVIESLNNLFIGGNTYIGGDDNLLTGSLFVAGATGTGVQITGKRGSAMIKSLGYVGFNNAITNTGQAGFVLYSGSISPIIGETGTSNNYSGVGLELVANSGSYFKYSTAAGGVLDIRTDKFFIGNSNVFLSGSNSNLEIKNKSGNKTNFHLRPNGYVTASAFIAFTGSSDASNFLMMDTSIGLIDGKNIGRILYSQGAPIMLSDAYGAGGASFMSGLSTAAFVVNNKSISTSLQMTTTRVKTQIKDAMTSSYNWRTLPNVQDVSFYTLPFENQVTIFGNILVDKKTAGTGSAALGGQPITGSLDPALGIALKFSIWEPITDAEWVNFGQAGSGSATAFLCGASGTVSYESTGSTIKSALDQTGNYAFIYGNSVTGTKTGSAATLRYIPFKATMLLPASASDKLVTFTADYQFIKVGGGYQTSPGIYYNDNFEFRVKLGNMTAIIGRTLQSTSTTGTGEFTSKASAGFSPPPPA